MISEFGAINHQILSGKSILYHLSINSGSRGVAPAEVLDVMIPNAARKRCAGPPDLNCLITRARAIWLVNENSQRGCSDTFAGYAQRSASLPILPHYSYIACL